MAVSYHCRNKDDISSGTTEYSYIRQGNKNNLEIGTDGQENFIKEICLICNEKFSFIQSPLALPEHKEIYVGFNIPKYVYCDAFYAEVYTDGIHINFFEEKARFYAKCGDLFFGFGKNRKITDIYFTNMPPKAISNAKEVLEWEQKCRNEQANK